MILDFIFSRLMLSCHRWVWGLVLLIGLSTPSVHLSGQEAETSIEELQKQWNELDAKLAAKEALIKSGEGDTAAVQKQFRELVEQADQIIQQMETAARSALKADPNNQEIVRLLMGIMLNDAQNNRDAKVQSLGDLLIAHGVNPEYFSIASRADRLAIPAREIFDELLIRHAEAMQNDLPRVKLTTTKGDIVLELFENEAPNTVGNFISLVEQGYFSDMLFHRVIEGFMAQGGGFKLEGDKEVGGEGPGYEIKCECDTPDKRLHFTGSISMAHRGKDTGGSQFFLTFDRTGFLDGRHTCFGRVIEGHDVLDKLTRTHVSPELSSSGMEEPIPDVTKDRIISAEVIRKRDHEYRPDKVGGNDEPATPEKSASDQQPDASDSKQEEDDKANSEKDSAQGDSESETGSQDKNDEEK